MARESKAEQKKRVKKIIAALLKQRPDPKPELNYSNPLELLVAVILSAQCTDVRVNIVTKDIFKKYKTADDYASAKQETLQEEIRSSGFYRNKAKNIRHAAAMMVADFDGKVPDNMEDLLKLPGVARKTANVILGNIFGKNEGIVVDTHMMRVSQRLKLTTNHKKQPEKIEQDLMAVAPQDKWKHFSNLIVLHGRYVCTARKPNCEQCAINKLCPSAFKV